MALPGCPIVGTMPESIGGRGAGCAATAMGGTCRILKTTLLADFLGMIAAIFYVKDDAIGEVL